LNPFGRIGKRCRLRAPAARTIYQLPATKETLIKYDTTNARSLDSAELPKKRQFCFARDDRDELNQGFPITNYRFSRLSAAPDRSLPLLSS